jgi:hypothetical protein
MTGSPWQSSDAKHHVIAFSGWMIAAVWPCACCEEELKALAVLQAAIHVSLHCELLLFEGTSAGWKLL